jgi:heme-degrading monooxygenase HmoA
LFVTLWEFEVKPGSEELFERTYGPDGAWGKLFRRDARYLGTRLLRDVDAARAYVTMDSWRSRAAYGEFRERFAKEYGELDRECEGMTIREKHLGEYQTQYRNLS